MVPLANGGSLLKLALYQHKGGINNREEWDQVWLDNRVGIALDTFNNQNRAFLFAISVLGIQREEKLGK